MARLRALVAAFRVAASAMEWAGAAQGQTDAEIKRVIKAHIGSLLASGSPPGTEIMAWMEEQEYSREGAETRRNIVHASRPDVASCT